MKLCMYLWMDLVELTLEVISNHVLFDQLLTSMLSEKKYLNIDCKMLEYNFVTFVSKFTFKYSKLQKRTKTVIVKTYPTYLSNPNNETYGLFCKYQLLKYKPWKDNANMAWDNLDKDDQTYITCWNQFLLTDDAKQLVPNWESKMQSVKAYVKPAVENLTSLDDNIEEEKEEWMLMAELHIQEKKDFEQLLIPPCSYWQEAKKLFSTEEIGIMPTWVTTNCGDPCGHYEKPT